MLPSLLLDSKKALGKPIEHSGIAESGCHNHNKGISKGEIFSSKDAGALGLTGMELMYFIAASVGLWLRQH